MSQWLTGLLLLGILGVFAWGFLFLWHKAEVDRLNERSSISLHDIYARYYATSGLSEASVLDIWQEIAVALQLPPEKMRPSDRFGEDVGTYLTTSDELDTLGELGEKRARRLGIQVDLSTLATIDDYIKALAQRK